MLVERSTIAAGARRGWRALRAVLPRRQEQATVLYVAPDGVRALGCDRRWHLDASDLPAWYETHPGRDAHVLLSARWLHLLTEARPHRAWAAPVRDAEQQGGPRERLVHFHGPAAASWPLAGWCGPGLQVTAALSAVDLDGWHAAAWRQGARLLSVRPWWTGALSALRVARWPGPGAAAAWLVEGGHGTWARFDNGQLSALRPSWLAAGDATAAATQLQAYQVDSCIGAQATRIAAFGLGPRAIQALQALGRLAGDPGADGPDHTWTAV